jgi:hypothetical protein
MHSIAASAAIRAGVSGGMRAIGSVRVVDDTNRPCACCHFSKNNCMSVARSLMIGRFSNGPMTSLPFAATLETCMRQVQRGRPFTVMAQEPHMPTRQAKR